MDYHKIEIEELLSDPFFQQWVLSPTHESDLFWIKWLLEHPDKKDMIEEARSIILSLDFKDDLVASEVDEEWEKLYSKLQNTTRFNLEYTNELGAGQSWWQGYMKLAAMFIGFIIAVGAYLTFSSSDKVENIVHSTAYGQTKELKLPDGSVVTLNAASKITFSPEWDDAADREVWIDGEAFFSVTHTKNHQKFIVHTDEHSSVEVLGTKFNVYDRREKLRVVLQEGKVQITAKEEDDPVLMAPGELVEWRRGDDNLQKQKVNPHLYTTWKEHEILFEKTPLTEVAQTLEDINGVKVNFHDSSLQSLNFTGSLSTNDLDNFLISLSKSFKIQVKHEGNQITLYR